MATSSVPVTHKLSCYGSQIDIDAEVSTAVSDYGSEFDATEIDEDNLLTSTFESLSRNTLTSVVESPALESIESTQGEAEERDPDGLVVSQKPSLLRVAKKAGRSVQVTTAHRDTESSPIRDVLEVEYDESSRRAWSVPLVEPRLGPEPVSNKFNRVSPESQSIRTPPPLDAAESDPRSPIERFRTKPKKPLSVTDLISPAWCELQYLYTLSKFGRKPRTQAMRTGTKIHQKLEEQVHTTVPVQVQTKVDHFGLRLWNTISGLRCLSETGLTRELEVWGVVEGEVINGVIDEVSYHCSDPDLEERLERTKTEKAGCTVPLPQDERSIVQAFAKRPAIDYGNDASEGRMESTRQIYITDVKTRGVRSKPTGASLRPTWMQLMLYRKLLESLSLNTVDAETIFARYNLSPLEPFTEIFLGEIGDIGPGNEAAQFPNLLSLWSLLVTELQHIIPPASLSSILRAEFHYSKSGDVLGSELVVYEADVIEQYIQDEMAWWKGTREAKGVEIEEAFKCRICDFAEDCTWRKQKVDEAVEKSRLRRIGKRQSAV